MASYRRNPDYNKQFAWTYKLNEDLHKCYVKAKEDRRIVYMNRLKSYWDEIHPQLSFFASENLLDQTSRVKKRKIAMTKEDIEINE